MALAAYRRYKEQEAERVSMLKETPDEVPKVRVSFGEVRGDSRICDAVEALQTSFDTLSESICSHSELKGACEVIGLSPSEGDDVPSSALKSVSDEAVEDMDGKRLRDGSDTTSLPIVSEAECDRQSDPVSCKVLPLTKPERKEDVSSESNGEASIVWSDKWEGGAGNILPGETDSSFKERSRYECAGSGEGDPSANANIPEEVGGQLNGSAFPTDLTDANIEAKKTGDTNLKEEQSNSYGEEAGAETRLLTEPRRESRVKAEGGLKSRLSNGVYVSYNASPFKNAGGFSLVSQSPQGFDESRGHVCEQTESVQCIGEDLEVGGVLDGGISWRGGEGRAVGNEKRRGLNKMIRGIVRNGIMTPVTSRRAQQLRVFSLSYFGYACLYSTRKPLSVLKTHIQRDLNLSTYTLGSIDTAFLAAYAVGQLCLSGMSDRVNPRYFLLFCYLGSATCAMTFGLSSSPMALIVSWLLNGLSHAAAFPLLLKLLVPWFSFRIRGRILGLWTTSQQVGAVGATAFAASISEVCSWRASFIIPAILSLFTGLILHRFMLDETEIQPNSPPSRIFVPTTSSSYSIFVTNKGLRSGRVSADYRSPKNISSEKNHLPREKINPARENKNAAREMRDLQPAGSSREMRDLTSGHDSYSPHTPTSEESFSETIEEETLCPAQRTSERNRKSERSSPSPPHTEKERKPCKPLSFREVLFMPHLLNLGAAYFCVKLIRYTLLFWLPYFLATELNFPPNSAGYSSMLFDAGGMAGSICTGYVADYLLSGRRITAACCMSVLSGFALLFFVLTSHWSPIYTLFSMAFIGFAIAGPDSILGASAAQDLCDLNGYGPAALGATAGVINGLGAVGAVLQGYLTAYLTQNYGWDSLFAFLCLLAVASMILTLSAIKQEQQTSKALAKNTHQGQ